MKIFFLFIVISPLLFSFNSKIGNEVIVFKFETLLADQEARDLQYELLNGYPEKISAVNYNLFKKEFRLTPTEHFNTIEILGFFRDRGHEASFIQNGIKYTLNNSGNSLIETHLIDKDNSLLKLK
jgi:hypothetical protein